MGKIIRPTFARVLHLAEDYQEEYKRRGLCLSPLQNEASFRDYVGQYYGALNHGEKPNPYIDINVPLF